MCEVESTALFTSRRVGTTGHEILHDGLVIAWAINEGTANLLVDALNTTVVVVQDGEEEGRSACLGLTAEAGISF